MPATQFFRLQRGVGGAEINGLGLDLGDTTAGADRLVVDLVAGGGVVVGRPLRHHRVDERGARAGDFSGVGGEHGRRCEDGNGNARLEGVDHGVAPGLIGMRGYPPGAHSITVR
ncbi:hypothetical protein G6F68_014638 [Rhizopus microsporus]|nr:hypothetical protein G6F68_014638 [Rhizopus microsporus]